MGIESSAQMAKAQKTAEALQKRARNFRLGVARMAITGGPIALKFGRGNDRAINPTELLKLKKGIIHEGVQVFNESSMIRVAVRKELLDTSSLEKRDDPPVDKVKEVQWTEKAHQIREVDALSGQHRQKAMESIREDNIELIESYKAKLEALEEGSGNEEEMDSLSEMIGELEEVNESLRWWTVVFYDDGGFTLNY